MKSIKTLKNGKKILVISPFDGEFIYLDIEMKDIIFVLWSKGIETKFCCSGHFYYKTFKGKKRLMKDCFGYILFKPKLDLSRLPKNCEAYKYAGLYQKSDNSIRWESKCCKERDLILKNLLSWAKRL